MINRHKIRSILDTTFENHVIAINNEFQRNIATNGQFSLTFDIWTSTTQIAYIKVILLYINKDFKLIYKLIGKLFNLLTNLLLNYLIY